MNSLCPLANFRLVEPRYTREALSFCASPGFFEGGARANFYAKRFPPESFSKALLVVAIILAWAAAGHVWATDEGYARYTDPERRFTFDYPATMKVNAPDKDEVKIYHAGATLRISVSVEKRPNKGAPSAEVYLEALKKKLKEEAKDVSILEEGKAPGITGAQGYIICSFRDHRGIQLVQLVQYYISDDCLLRMIISDRPQGFKNLERVIRNIHHSLRILIPKLS